MNGDVLAFAGEPVLDVGSQPLAGLEPQHRQIGVVGQGPERQRPPVEAGQRLRALGGDKPGVESAAGRSSHAAERRPGSEGARPEKELTAGKASSPLWGRDGGRLQRLGGCPSPQGRGGRAPAFVH